MDKTFDPTKIEAIFTLVSSVKNNLLGAALNAAMANLVKALEFYLVTPMLKKEREVLEFEFHDLLIKISKHPKFAGTYGPVSFRKGEHKMNVDFMKQLIKFAAENLEEKIKQGLELLEASRLDEAHALFLEVLNDPDAELQYFMTVGDAYLQKQRWKEAQEIFALAVAKDPESINVMNRLAISLRKDKKYNEAMEIYRKAIMLSPRDEGLYYNLARLFLDMGNPQSAGQALRKSLAINPKFAPAAKLMVGVQETLAGLSPKAKAST
ncbi:MAG: tetratricopeptide repeat protein [Thermodesulfobacteriota bacterium]